jgi:transcriptional regulator with XRE-family HTH domain
MNDDIRTRVGVNIIRIREKRGLSQERLGALAGLHRAYIGQVERGEKNIGLKNLDKIAKALNVDIKVLVDIPAIYR